MRARWAALGAGVLFFAIACWWVLRDRSVPVFDSGLHLSYAFNVHDAWRDGDIAYPFTTFTNYPPLVHIVGALAAFVGGVHVAPPILAQNLIFMPLLAAGCYGTGRRAFGPLAGLLAVLFALGTPMLISQFHVFLLDAPEAAMVAASTWAILASERFSRPRVAALAGVLCGLGMLSKQTFPIFVAGLLLVVLQRGGWRERRGLLAFAAPFVLVGAPWYLAHLDDLGSLRHLVGGVGSDPVGAAHLSMLAAGRWSSKNFGWYFWDAVNLQLLAPLAAFVVVGAVACLARFWRDRDPADVTPELVVGGLCSYLGMTYIWVKDPRYTLPALVYMAVLGTGWIPLLRLRSLRIAAAAVVAGLAVMNTVAVSFGVGHDVRLTLPGAPNSGLHERAFTLYSPLDRGGPKRTPDVLATMRALRKRGIRVVDFDPGSANVPAFNTEGLRAFARIAGLTQPGVYDPGKLQANDAFMLRRQPGPGDPPPCIRFSDGSGVYIELGSPLKPFADYTFVCPGRRPSVYRRTARPPGTISPATRSRFLRLFRALSRNRVRVIEFDPGSGGSADFAIDALTALAARAGLHRPASYAPAALRAHDAFLLRHVPQPGDPAPCVRLSDGAGAYVVLGDPLVPFDQYRFVCPTR